MARILLVHGAFGGAWCWEPVLPGLRAAGHVAEAIDLPGAGTDPTPLAEVTLDSYVERVCDALAQGPPAMLVGASMGGVVITAAAAHCPERVAALVYVSAFVPADGQSLMDLVALPEAAGDQVQANLVVQGDPPIARLPAQAAREALFGCASEQQATWAAGRLGPQPVAPFAQRVSVGGPGAAAFATLRRAYISCTRDRAIPPAMQRRMLEAAGCEPVIELDTDHCPWLSRIDELVIALSTLAGDGDGSSAPR